MELIGVLIIPTGIGAEIGGHAGDANPVAKLLASCCDKLIIHPNVCNDSDINEMPNNSLYVEGSILDRFLEGHIELQEVRMNRILVAVNAPVENTTVNAVSAARVTIGADIEIAELEMPLVMKGRIKEGRATGSVFGWEELIEQIEQFGNSFDALALHTPIEVDKETRMHYYEKGGVNPWGWVEAKASKLVADGINKPVAHAPLAPEETYDEVVDPRMAAEMLSSSYLHSVLKGLHRAPRIGRGLSVKDVDCLVSPFGCVGTPHEACLMVGIPVIVVKENRTVLNDPMPSDFILVENYLEAAGLIVAMREGISIKSIRRPVENTLIR